MNRFASILIKVIVVLWIPEVAWAQTATSLISNDPQAQYRNVKKVIIEEIKKNGAGLMFGDNNKELDLYYCSDFSDMGSTIGKENSRVSQLMSVAYDIGLYEISLSSVGYPQSLWIDFLKKREEAGLNGRRLRFHDTDANNDNEKRDLKRFASILNSYRENGHRNLPKVVIDGGCGAGGTTVSFRTNPPGGRVLLVPKMYYSLCRIQGIDPDDEKKCDFWHEVFKEQEPEVSGDYFVKIIWRDRSVTRNFSASKLGDGSNKITLQ